MEISTKRLLLRDVAPEDEVALLALETDPALSRYRDSAPPSEEQVRALEKSRGGTFLPGFFRDISGGAGRLGCRCHSARQEAAASLAGAG